jgi:hypothetical protein
MTVDSFGVISRSLGLIITMCVSNMGLHVPMRLDRRNFGYPCDIYIYIYIYI